jgi:hypothetical protein
VRAEAWHGGAARVRSVLAALAVLALVGGLSLIGGRASAALRDVTDLGMPGHLSLSAGWSTRMLDMSPGEPGHWLIDAHLDDVPHATLAVEIRADGEIADLEHGMLLRLDRCDVGWTPAVHGAGTMPTCAVGSRAVLEPTPLSAFRAAGPRMGLPDITATDGEHLMLTAALDDARAGDPELMGLTGTLAVGLHAQGGAAAAGSAAPPAGGLLPRTGAGFDVAALALVGAGALGLGLLARTGGRRRRDEQHATSPGAAA